MELWSKIVPLDAFNVIAHHCFKTPTHVEEIIAQDKQLLVYRLVCKKWESFFNVFLQTRFDTVNFESMQGLFVKKRHWNYNFFQLRYLARIRYLKKLIIINNSQAFLNWIVKQEEEVACYEFEEPEKNLNSTHSLFDWSVVSKLDYEAEWAPYAKPELSFHVFQSYLSHGGFVPRELVPKLLWFLFNELDRYIKYDQKISRPYNHTHEHVFKYIYFNDEKFNKDFLANMNFSYFLGALLRKMHNVGGSNCFNFKRYQKAEFLSKQLFLDLKDLPLEVNYGELIENIYLGSFKCQKHFTEIFFNKFRYYFFPNFEGRSFLRTLLQYRLKYHQGDDYKKPGFLISISNTNRLILDFIREFKSELNNCSLEQKKEYLKLFISNEKLNIPIHSPFLHSAWFEKNLKKEKAIANLLDSFVLSVPPLLVVPVKIIKGIEINIQKSYPFNNNSQILDQCIEQLDNLKSVASENISSRVIKQSDNSEESDSKQSGSAEELDDSQTSDQSIEKPNNSEKLNNFQSKALENIPLKTQNNQKPRNIILRKIVLGITFFICGFLCLGVIRAFYRKLII